MHINKYLKILNCFILMSFMFSTQMAFAGVFSDVKMWVKERKEIRAHSSVVKDSMKTLFKERKSIKDLAVSAANLVKHYVAIFKKKAKLGITQLLDIANSIAKAVKSFNKLAPIAKNMYERSKNSLRYFSDLAERSSTGKKLKPNMIKTIPNSRISKLAASNGWSRVFSSVKSNPLNIFKWGQLKDEYELGKMEGTYPLKCAQITIESVSYFQSAKNSISSLLGIQDEIKGMLNGNLSNILNAGETVKKIENSGDSIEKFADATKRGYEHINGRLEEFDKIQNDYASKLEQYREKYTTTASNGSNNDSYPRPSTSSTSTATNPFNNTTNINATTSSISSAKKIDIQTAMKYYQTAYKEYIEISNNSKASQSQVNQAASKLRQAKQIVSTAQTQSSNR